MKLWLFLFVYTLYPYKFMPPVEKNLKWVSVDEFIENLEQQRKSKPDDYTILFDLASLHTVAYAVDNEWTYARTRESAEDKPPQLYLGPHSVSRPIRKTMPALQSLQHLDKAIKLFAQLVNMKCPQNHALERGRLGLKYAPVDVWLGLAFVLEAGIPYAESLSCPNHLSGAYSTEAFRQHSLNAYRKVYSLCATKDLKSHGYVGRPNTWEAAQGILRLQRGRKLTVSEKQELQRMKMAIQYIEKQPKYVV